VLLMDVDHNDRRLLSERMDQLWTHYAKHSHSTMACIEGASSDEDGGAVAAIRRRGPGGRNFGSKPRLRKGAWRRWGGLSQPIGSSSSSGLSNSSLLRGGCAGTTTPSATRPTLAGSRARGPRKTSHPGSSRRHRPCQVSPRPG
jgi:hypothetical protein